MTMTASSQQPKAGRPLTGWHVLAITCSAFAVIIGVNVFMAFKAVATFPGLEEASSYVASQNFDRRREAQEALGWTMAPDYRDGRVVLTFTDADGRGVEVQDLQVLIGRKTSSRDDATPAFTGAGGLYQAEQALAPGWWMLRVKAHALDGTLFEQRSEVFVRG